MRLAKDKLEEIESAIKAREGSASALAMRFDLTPSTIHGHAKRLKVTLPDGRAKETAKETADVPQPDTRGASVSAAFKRKRNAEASTSGAAFAIAALQHTLKCIDTDCEKCMRIEGHLEDRDLGSAKDLATALEHLAELKVLASELVDASEGRMGPDHQRLIRLAATKVRRSLAEGPSLRNLPPENLEHLRRLVGGIEQEPPSHGVIVVDIPRRTEPETHLVVRSEQVEVLQARIAELELALEERPTLPAPEGEVTELRDHIVTLSMEEHRLRRMLAARSA